MFSSFQIEGHMDYMNNLDGILEIVGVRTRELPPEVIPSDSTLRGWVQANQQRSRSRSKTRASTMEHSRSEQGITERAKREGESHMRSSVTEPTLQQQSEKQTSSKDDLESHTSRSTSGIESDIEAHSSTSAHLSAIFASGIPCNAGSTSTVSGFGSASSLSKSPCKVNAAKTFGSNNSNNSNCDTETVAETVAADDTDVTIRSGDDFTHAESSTVKAESSKSDTSVKVAVEECSNEENTMPTESKCQ